MKVKLHGTRGSYPLSSDFGKTYGGNTPCVEVIGGSRRLILDAGTGILGVDFDSGHPSNRIDIFLTHLHMDHIQGLAFFKPLFNPSNEIHLWGPQDSTSSLQNRLNQYLSPPLFPIPLRDIPSKLHVHELANTTMDLGDFVLTSEFISHPGPTLGYRIQHGSKTVCYLPDHEPIIGRSRLYPEDEWISGFDLAHEVDLLIHDAQYNKKEYKSKPGWGHSSIDLAARFCARTKARRLVLFHHDPAHSDKQIKKMFEKLMRKTDYDFPIELAVQGQEIEF
ncbi:MAG: MBL fold metallo-hydrolase [Robiginitalea sp.]|jgi:phosphoribosyl 1,2-cyclic phosphodiesterase